MQCEAYAVLRITKQEMKIKELNWVQVIYHSGKLEFQIILLLHTIKQ
jgi:hypothetical protein